MQSSRWPACITRLQGKQPCKRAPILPERIGANVHSELRYNAPFNLVTTA